MVIFWDQNKSTVIQWGGIKGIFRRFFIVLFVFIGLKREDRFRFFGRRCREPQLKMAEFRMLSMHMLHAPSNNEQMPHAASL